MYQDFDVGTAFYGLAAGLMWLHTLNFVYVHPDLGQASLVLFVMCLELVAAGHDL